jgi:hypothetical protein
MHKEDVRTRLAELHRELERTQSMREDERRRLLKLASDIEASLETTDTADHQTSVSNLEDAVQRFEVTHPELTAVLARLINSLSNMGI